MSRFYRPPLRRGIVDRGLVAVGLVVFVLDQLTKQVITQGLGPDAPQNSVEVAGSFLRLSYVTNTGAAFGLFPEGTVVFTLVALIAVPLLLFSRLFLAVDNLLVRLSLGLLLGGALGNLVDRLRLGYVVDFVDVGIEQLRWPSFNVADSAFVVGVAILALYMLFWTPTADEPRQSQSSAASQQRGPEDRSDRACVA